MQANTSRSRVVATRFIAALFCIAVATVGAGGARAEGDGSSGGIAWSKAFTRAVRQAKTSKKLVMVDFYTDWCGWCKELDKTTYKDKKIIRLTKTTFIPIKINAEKEGQKAAAKYGVRSYPMILFVDGDGAVAGRIGGFAPAAPFAAQMEKIAADARALPLAAAKFKKKPDVATAAKLTDIYAGRGDEANAGATYAFVKQNDAQNRKGYLVKVANQMGDLYESKTEPNKAIPYFQQAAQVAKVSGDAAYAHMSIAGCYAGMRDIPRAIAAIQTGLADVKVSTSDKQEMKAMLKQLNGTPRSSGGIAAH